jgi:hypothetical protein
LDRVGKNDLINTRMKTKIGRFVFFVAYACIACSFQTADKDYIDYFRKVNVAESFIRDSNYEKALTTYDELIASYPNHFYKDLHNACVCALRLEKYRKALSLASALVGHGYELKDFESSTFDSFRNQKNYWNQFLTDYPGLRQQYEKNLDIPLRNQYIDLYEIDQQVAALGQGSKKFPGLALSLSNLIKESGFPHWLQNKDTIQLKLYVLLRHFCGFNHRLMNNAKSQQDSLYARMNQNDIPLLVEQALHKGLITPDMYENATTYWDYSNPYGKLAIMIDYNTEKVYPFLQAAPEAIPEINNRRNNIGLPLVTGEELSDNILYSTWYRFYPFQAIKEAFLSCDTCNSLDNFLDIKRSFENNIMNEFLQKKDTDFILRDWEEVHDFHYMGIMPIVNSKLKKNGIDTQ